MKKLINEEGSMNTKKNFTPGILMHRACRSGNTRAAILFLRMTILPALLAIVVTSCTSTGFAEPYAKKIGYKLVVEGFEWGPSITKAVLIFENDVSAGSFDNSTFTVIAGDSKRTVIDTYVSDEKGARAASGSAIAIELKIGYASEPIENSSPFNYNVQTNRNEWVPLDIYTISTNEGKSVVIGGKAASFIVMPENYQGKVSPSTDHLAKSSHVFNNIKLNYASYEPAAFKSDGGKNPLIIWLHGAGGGSATDPDIALYDTDGTAIIEPGIQKYFKTNGLEGACTLYPQAPTWWMDNGRGEMTAQGPDSAFTEVLKSLIDFYVKNNPDIDTDRIYIVGLSNGGYMTVNMLTHYPGFFAAAFPICEAFLDSELTDEAIRSLADEAVWFVHSANDPIVPPETSVLGTYARLVRAGARNVHFSYFENVVGQDAPGVEYSGHFSWIYVLQDRASLDQDIAAVRSSGLAAIKAPSAVPVKVNDAAVTMWGWLSMQKK
jgi:predicted peptidase